MACAICRVRKPRRYCPGVRGDICTLCCGNEREVTVECPFDCPYLEEARKHERTQLVNPDTFPNQDIRLKEEFLEEHEELLVAAGRSLLQAALDTPGAVDTDVREALDGLIRTSRTLQSGAYSTPRKTAWRSFARRRPRSWACLARGTAMCWESWFFCSGSNWIATMAARAAALFWITCAVSSAIRTAPA